MARRHGTTGTRAARRLADMCEETPGLSLAAVGLGLCVANRMARLQASTAPFPSLDVMAACTGALALVMALAALLYRVRPAFRLHRHPVPMLLLALACATACLLSRGAVTTPVSPVLTLACEIITQVGAGLLVLAWGETLYAYGLRRVVGTLGLAGVVCALITAALGAIRQEMEVGLLACLPIFSVICLYFFLEFNSSRSGFAVERAMRGPGAGHAEGEGSLASPAWGAVACCALFFFLVRFCLGYATTNWVAVCGEQGANVTSQASSAVGMALAGAFLLAVATSANLQKALCPYPFALTAIVFIALICILALDTSFTWVSVTFVVLEQVLLVLPAFVAPFLAGAAGGRTAGQTPGTPDFSAEAGVYCACAAGSAVGAAFQGHAAGGLLVPALLAALICLTATALLLARGCDAGQTASNGAAEIQACPPTPGGQATDGLGHVASLYGLTRREQDILSLLAIRRSATEIAETLVVSVPTVRTHVRNIYAKLDVHSAKELHELLASQGVPDT